MAELAVVRRYARALFDAASHSGVLGQVEEDLKAIDQALGGLPRLQRALRAPTVSISRKKELLGRAFGGRIRPLTLRFLHLTLDRRREGILSDVYPEFQRLANEARNILPVTVTAAIPLTDADRDALTRALGQRTGKSIVLQVGIDPHLMGGVLIRMGDTIIDGSIRTKLEQLRTQLLTGRVVQPEPLPLP